MIAITIRINKNKMFFCMDTDLLWESSWVAVSTCGKLRTNMTNSSPCLALLCEIVQNLLFICWRPRYYIISPSMFWFALISFTSNESFQTQLWKSCFWELWEYWRLNFNQSKVLTFWKQILRIYTEGILMLRNWNLFFYNGMYIYKKKSLLIDIWTSNSRCFCTKEMKSLYEISDPDWTDNITNKKIGTLFTKNNLMLSHVNFLLPLITDTFHRSFLKIILC